MVKRRELISGLGLCIVSGLAGCTGGDDESVWVERDVEALSYRGRVSLFNSSDFSEEFVGNNVWLVQLEVQSVPETEPGRFGVYVLANDMEGDGYETRQFISEKGEWVYLGDMVDSEGEGLGESRVPAGSEWFAKGEGERGWYGFQGDDLLAITSSIPLKDMYMEEIVDTVRVSELR